MTVRMGPPMNDWLTERGQEPMEEISDIVDLSPAETPAARPLPQRGDGALIVCDNLVKIYKVADLEVVALQGLDLLVEPGEFIAIVGASGSGKSTLLNILGGLDVPSAGRATVAGHLLGEMDASERTALSAAGDRLRLAADGAEPAAVPHRRRERRAADAAGGRGRASERQRARRSCSSWSGWRERADHRPDRLSGGEQQRVAIAVALANEPAVLFADEPTGELDTATAHEVFELLRTVNQRPRRHDRGRHPRSAGQRARQPHRRDPRRAHQHGDAPPPRASRTPATTTSSPRSTPSSTASAACSCRASTSRPWACNAAFGSRWRTTTSGSGPIAMATVASEVPDERRSFGTGSRRRNPLTAEVDAQGLVRDYAMGGGVVRAVGGIDLRIERGALIAVMGAPDRARRRCCR